MRKTNSGFSAVEILVVLVVVGIVGGLGYVFYNRMQGDTTPATQASTTQPMTTSDVPTAPQITTVSDLDNAQQALDQSNVSSSSDTSQLDNNTSSF
jgi:prepilin-type N-terminal cleavage/methylation domain-containing protein